MRDQPVILLLMLTVKLNMKILSVAISKKPLVVQTNCATSFLKFSVSGFNHQLKYLSGRKTFVHCEINERSMFRKPSAMSLLLLLLVAYLFDHIEGVNNTGSSVSKVRIYNLRHIFLFSHMTPGRYCIKLEVSPTS